MRMEGRKYLYKMVYNTLKDEILDGTYPYDIILPSEREISARFTVDRTTVRKALEFLVSDGLVEKHAGVGTKVIYHPDDRRTPVPGLGDDLLVGFFIVEDSGTNKKISQPFYADLFYQVENQCKNYAANVIYSTIKNEDDLVNMITKRRFCGIIFASRTEEVYVEIAEAHGIKVAQILGYNSKGLTICYDSTAAGFVAINYLARCGHRDIALITGPKDFHSSQDRLAGVLLALFKHDLIIDKSHVFEGNWEYESGYQNALHILALPQRPTAIYSFNDMMSLGAMQAIADSGLKIPRDISIISSDNMSTLRTNEQVLTTTDVKIAKLAETAIDYFFNGSSHYMDGMKIIVPVEFLEGDTVRNLNAE